MHIVWRNRRCGNFWEGRKTREKGSGTVRSEGRNTPSCAGPSTMGSRYESRGGLRRDAGLALRLNKVAASIPRPTPHFAKGQPLMTTHPAGHRPRRRLRAVLVGLGLDDADATHRIINGEQCLILGGSEAMHADMLETVLRLESELERRGRSLGEVSPADLADIAWRIDSPELHRIALRMHHELGRRGLSFHDSSPEELTEIALGDGS